MCVCTLACICVVCVWYVCASVYERKRKRERKREGHIETNKHWVFFLNCFSILFLETRSFTKPGV